MEFSDSTKVVFQRIHELDPENAAKIIGYLLLEDHSEEEMMKLACSSDNTIRTFINKAKRDLRLFSKKTISDKVVTPKPDNPAVSKLPTKFTPFTPSSSHSPLSYAAPGADNSTQYPQPHVNHQVINNCAYVPLSYLDPSSIHNPLLSYFDSSSDGYGLYNLPLSYMDPSGFEFNIRPPVYPLLNQMQQACNFDGSFLPPVNSVTVFAQPQMPDQRLPFLPDSSVKFCEKFSKGYCKYGENCKFLHVLHRENDHVVVLNPPNTYQTVKEDRFLPHGSLKKLEMEVIEILESKRGVPVPISCLPAVYREKYGRVLQVEGYLKEMNMQGIVGGGLSQLLARMSKRIRFIERDGQYCVILAQHIPKFIKFMEETKEQESVSATSCQVYLTFSPQSSFSKQDAYNYFKHFGPVQEVRIPNVGQRTYGFVTFVRPETAALVLAKGNPHFIRGAKVLVKSFQNKPIIDSEPEEIVKIDAPTTPNVPSKSIFTDSSSSGPGSRPLSTTRQSNNIWILKKQTTDEPEQTTDPKGKRIMEPKLIDSSSHQSFFSYSINDFHFDKRLDSFEGAKNGCSSTAMSRQIKIHNDENESYEELNLPESPFA